MMKGYSSLLLLVTAVFVTVFLPGCAGMNPAIPQIKEVTCTPSEFDTAVAHVSSNLRMELETVNDSVIRFTQWPLHAVDVTKDLKLLKKWHGDSLRLVTKGVLINKDGNRKGPADDMAFLLNSALEQEIGFIHKEPVYDQRLPKKSTPLFCALSTINPGLGVIYGYNNPFTKRLAVWGGLFFGALDIGYVYMVVRPSYYRSEEDTTKIRSTKPIGWLGVITFRALMYMCAATDLRIYKLYSDSPYYFKFDNVNKKASFGYEYQF